MRFVALGCFIFSSSVAAAAVPCDKQSATLMESQLNAMGHAEPGAFRWAEGTNTMPDRMRASLMESYAKADACLTGKPRVINFYLGQKGIGHVDADGFFVPIDRKYDLPPRAGVHVWLDVHTK